MKKTKAEESKELEDQVAAFLKKGGKIKQVDTRESKLKDMLISNRFFAKTHYNMFESNKKSSS